MADVSNIEIGAVDVTYKSTALGHTKEGAVVTYEPVFHDIMVDKYGETVVEKVHVGERLTVEVTLAEYGAQNLKYAMPATTKNTDEVQIGKEAGTKMSTEAGILILHPIANAAGDKSEDVVLWNAIASEPVELPYQVDEERVFSVTFEALIDESKDDGELLGVIGDSAT